MSSLRMPGIATGLDTSSIISQLMAVERKPVNMLQTRQNTTQGQLDAYRAINVKLTALQASAKALMGVTQNLSPFSSMAATSSNSAVFSAAISGTASPGTYNVSVSQLASFQSYAGNSFTGGQAGSFTITTGGNTATINVTASDTAQTIADQINTNIQSGMNATVVGGNLVMTAKNSGVAGNSSITSSSGAAFMTSIFGNAPTNTAGVDAAMTVNGIALTSSTNTFKNALSGVDLTAASVGSGTVTIAADNSAVINDVKDLVAKFNDIITTISQDTAYDKTTKKGGVLAGDAFVANLASQLTAQLTGAFDTSAYNTSGLPGLRNYTDTGISVQKDGTLTLDTTKLAAALQNYPTQTPGSASAYQLFAFEDGKMGAGGTKLNNVGSAGAWGDGIANRLSAFVDEMTSASSLYNSPNPSGGRYQGALITHINTLSNQITDYGTQITQYNNRLADYQRFLQSQFDAMEKSVQKLRSQGSYFSSQSTSPPGG